MAWRIDRDYLYQNDPGFLHSQVGRSSVKEFGTGERFRFRLCDDDGEVYYGGEFDLTHADEGADWESSPMGAWKWGESDSGATDFQMHVEDAIRAGLWTAELRTKYGWRDGQWVSIYG